MPRLYHYCYARFHLFQLKLMYITFLLGHPALTPEDIKEGATPKDDKNQSRGRSRALIPCHLDDSCSRQVLRDLSPLGTRIYAAPEILSGIKDAPPENLDNSCRRRLTRRKSSTKCTNNYGMIADAYSVGNTIR